MEPRGFSPKGTIIEWNLIYDEDVSLYFGSNSQITQIGKATLPQIFNKNPQDVVIG
jgi:hypothetical protein